MHAIAGAIALVIALLLNAAANAQTYPSRPITMVVPFPPGGNTDIMARALQAEMSKALGTTVVIINKGGAAGTLGLIDVARAAPDGYTIALSPNNPLTAQPHLQKLPYGMDSFRYICLTYYAPYVLIAGPKAPFKTFDEFVKFTKAKSENLVFGHPGLASQPHLGMLAVLKAIGGDGLGVPFTGAGPMAQALLERHRDGDLRDAGRRRREQSADPGRTVGDAARRTPEHPHDEGARPPRDIVHGRRRDRAGKHTARGGGHAGEGLRRRDGAAGIQDHRRPAQCRGALSRRRGVP